MGTTDVVVVFDNLYDKICSVHSTEIFAHIERADQINTYRTRYQHGQSPLTTEDVARIERRFEVMSLQKAIECLTDITLLKDE